MTKISNKKDNFRTTRDIHILDESEMVKMLEGMKARKERSKEDKERYWKETLNKLYEINSLTFEIAGTLLDGPDKVDEDLGQMITDGRDQARREKKQDRKSKSKFLYDSQQKNNSIKASKSDAKSFFSILTPGGMVGGKELTWEAKDKDEEQQLIDKALILHVLFSPGGLLQMATQYKNSKVKPMKTQKNNSVSSQLGN